MIAVEPAACPSLTKGAYAYDFGDTGHLTPLVKMHTLGSTFVPPPFHAGGLRYHGMAPMVSHLHELGLIEARAYTQTEVFEAGVEFARVGGDPSRARGEPRGQGGDRRGPPLPRGGRLARRSSSTSAGTATSTCRPTSTTSPGKLDDHEYAEDEVAMALAGLPSQA